MRRKAGGGLGGSSMSTMPIGSDFLTRGWGKIRKSCRRKETMRKSKKRRPRRQYIYIFGLNRKLKAVTPRRISGKRLISTMGAPGGLSGCETARPFTTTQKRFKAVVQSKKRDRRLYAGGEVVNKRGGDGRWWALKRRRGGARGNSRAPREKAEESVRSGTPSQAFSTMEKERTPVLRDLGEKGPGS